MKFMLLTFAEHRHNRRGLGSYLDKRNETFPTFSL